MMEGAENGKTPARRLLSQIVNCLMTAMLFIILVVPLSEGAACRKAAALFEKAKEQLGNDSASLKRKELLYKEAIKLCPSYAEAHNDLGDVYERQGRLREAIREYKMAIRYRPSAPYPYLGLGDVYYKMNSFKAAGKWYETGLKCDPTDKLARHKLALANDAQGKGVIRAKTIEEVWLVTRQVREAFPIIFGNRLIHFEFDETTLTRHARVQLDEIGKALRTLMTEIKHTSGWRLGDRVEIVCYTNTRGTAERSLFLSKKRAESIVQYLVKNFGLPRDKLEPLGCGNSVPVCVGDGEECRRANNRVEILWKRGL